MTRIEIGADTALRCVECDRWDLREARLVDEQGFVLLRGTACPHCRRHRAGDEPYASARQLVRAFGQVGQ